MMGFWRAAYTPHRAIEIESHVLIDPDSEDRRVGQPGAWNWPFMRGPL
jgi:hypothetical protein